jgi:hypothetical protein
MGFLFTNKIRLSLCIEPRRLISNHERILCEQNIQTVSDFECEDICLRKGVFQTVDGNAIHTIKV